MLSEWDEFTNQDPFEIVPVVRGLTEIKDLLTIVRMSGGFVAGGYARYCVSPLPRPALPSDVDVFCTASIAYDSIVERLVEAGATIKITTVNATTIIPPKEWVSCPTIQIIKPEVMVGDPWSIISKFDFTIAIAALQGGDFAMVHPSFMVDEHNQRLVVQHIQCPVGQMRRAMKYCKKGYKFPVKQMLKLYDDWDTKTAQRKEDIKKVVNLPEADWTDETRNQFRDMIYVD